MAEEKKNNGVNEEQAAQEETKEVAQKEQAAPPAKKASASQYVTAILEKTKNEFLEINEGLDMDFVHLGDWLVVDKKGNFVEKDNEEVVFGDTIDVVIAQGEKRWTLWGHEGTAEEGMLIVAEQDQENAYKAFAAWLEENPDAADRYTQQDVKLRYMAYVVPVDSLKADDFPQVYVMSFSQTDTIEYGRWAMGLYKGKFKKTYDIPGRTAVNSIVTRLSTKTKKSKANATISWIGLTFEPVGIFSPEDYGINPAETVND